ncbi:MAG TPA: phytanoyl-CoA dioxygenase family protein [Fimbriimonadaceae bacterium]|nr:phytanoyl-CoA dioxygenase family protein [Fimbriimonadaceae bacterium]
MNSINRVALAKEGFDLVPDVVSDADIEALLLLVQVRGAGERNLLDSEIVADLASSTCGALASEALGTPCWAVRAILFDKQDGTNWKVPWHQDCTIAVKERHDLGGYSGWSEKLGVPHVRPPAHVLERMISVRLHLDPCGADNGPLVVLPGTHTQGVLSSAVKERVRAEVNPAVLTADKGSAILMRPLLMHSSSPATNPSHRRVLHIDYACTELPPPLEWYWRI